MTTETNKIDFADIVSVIKRLTDILSIEIQMIKDMKLAKLHTLQDEKLKLLSVVESFKETIQENPDILASINEATKRELTQANNEFEKLINEDGEQLIKAKKVHQIIMESIRKVLDDKQKNSMSYNQEGIIGSNKKKILSSSPFTINSTI
ncbi:MAG: hypothetical protein COV35_09440 [Alphaproteobacteria bacterium CG11_big_fil_rev_8_21_14_0_20_39_49]|nr:MAG: hypothetical protein COV35_09440 [Alphaproteobacteria bacterium CG11_big_fil_rev_8_21_14_0_20_39_49]